MPLPAHMIHLLFWALLLIGSVPASAQDTAGALETPFLILRLEAELGYSLQRREAGMSGAVYTLAPPVGPPLSRLQIAYDGAAAPVLARLVAPIPGTEAAGGWVDAASALMTRLRGPGDGTQAAHVEALRQALLALDPDTEPAPIPGSADPPITLRALSDEGIAVLDIPVTASPARRLRGEALYETLADATLKLAPAAEGAQTLSRYHAPDGRHGGGVAAGETTETGSWHVSANGTYCVERAPAQGFRCALVYRLKDGSLRLVPILDDRPDGRGLRGATRHFGNPGSHIVPRRSDAANAAVVRMILPGRTEERRREHDGTASRLYLAENGAFSGRLEGRELRGAWTVLDDGRRCLIPVGETPECAFLSETDGGTYRLFDIRDGFLGEVRYLSGNRTGN